jgi:5-methylcytosine-specific restriction protein A
MTMTFILTWNPDGFVIDDAEYEDSVQDIQNGIHDPDACWSTGNRKSGIEIGDRFFLFRQKRERGIVASGYFTSEIFVGDHWNGSGRYANFAGLEFDDWRRLEDRLAVDDLLPATPGFKWSNLQGSGILLPPSDADVVEQLWSKPDNGESEPLWDDLELVEEFPSIRTSYAYDHNPIARRQCISHWGYSCSVCGFEYSKKYGPRGKDFIHVHHLHDISLSGEEHVVHPINDLRPVCANCHSMLHTERPAISIERLRLEISMEEQQLVLATK